tara:strand:+ start:1295 stop:2134 length:840 start_codon:yes stop_codon:yes gene_type:complete
MAYIGAQPSFGNFQACDAITTSATDTFNLTVGGVAISPVSAQHCLVSLNGVLQAPISSYTISGSTIVFAAALTSSDSIDFITIMGDTLDLGTPSDSTVTNSKLVSALQVGKQTMWVPAVAMYPNSTNGCADLAQVELSNGPEIKVLDFDKSSDEFAQFAVAFPKSWNEGTVTFQAFFTATSTNTGTTAWGLSGVAIADNGSCNTAFGTQVVATAKAHSGTSNDLDVSAESGAVTIAGSPSTDEQVFFQISRDVSADDLNADARLLGIKLFFTTDAANDS